MSILIVGGGTVGSDLADALRARGHAVVVIEKREPVAVELRARLADVTVIHGDGDEPITLEEANISHASAVAAVTDEDEDNLITCLLARREYGVARTVARINTQSNAWLFGERFGVDESFHASDFDLDDIVRRIAEGGEGAG